MRLNFKILFFSLVFFALPFLPRLTAGSEPDQIKERKRKIELLREKGEREKLNYRGMEIPVYNGEKASLSQEQEKMILAIFDDFKVNDDTGTTEQRYPAIALDSSGNFVITWTDTRNSNSDIYVQRYDSSGTPQGSNLKVNTDTGTAGQYDPAILLDDSGNFIITWEDYRNGNFDIYAQRYNSSGTPQGSNFEVNDDTGTAEQRYPAIAGDGSGNFVITWHDDRNGNFDIYAQRYNSSGTPQGSNFKVNDDTGTVWQYFPAIAIDGSDNFVITWEDYRNGNFDIYAQRYNSSGAPQDSNFKVNDDAGISWQRSPAIARDGSGNFAITWHDDRNGNFDIYAQRYNSSGIPQDSNFKVNNDTGTTNQYSPAIALDDSGNFVIAWEDSRNAGYDIYAQRYVSSGDLLGTNYLVTNPGTQTEPTVGFNGSNVYFAWQDYRNGNWDIYAKVVDWIWPHICGDANGDISVTVSDVVYLINYLFKGGPAPLCAPAPYLTCGDANGDEQITVSDVVYLINYLFKGGPQPVC